MRMIDHRGRLFGWVNVIDLVLVLGVLLFAAAAYTTLSAPYRVAPVLLTQANRVWVDVDLHLPAGADWLADFIVPGAQELDPRTGEVIGEVLRARLDGERVLVAVVRLLAARDGRGRLVRGGELLAPGRELTVTTEACVLKGLAGRIVPVE